MMLRLETLKIELLADNIAECRANLLDILAEYLNLEDADELYQAASYVLAQNSSTTTH